MIAMQLILITVCTGFANAARITKAMTNGEPTPTPGDPLNVERLKTAFHSPEGLTLRVADPAERSASNAKSATVWRSDLPIGLYAGWNVKDRVGIIFAPKSTQAQCAYTNNAFTQARADGPCTNYKSDHPMMTMAENMSGQCNYATSQEYVNAYLATPGPEALAKLSPFLFIQLFLCHFTSVTEMLDAQKEFLNQSDQTPANVTREAWLKMFENSLSSYNEVMIEPYRADSVAGLFWAHGGQFRDPLATDCEACKMARFLKEGKDRLPVFELAGVALQNPSDGQGLPFGPSSLTSDQKEEGLDWLGEAIGQWKANMTAGGGQRSASSVFRLLNDEVFTSLLETCKEHEDDCS